MALIIVRDAYYRMEVCVSKMVGLFAGTFSVFHGKSKNNVKKGLFTERKGLTHQPLTTVIFCMKWLRALLLLLAGKSPSPKHFSKWP